MNLISPILAQLFALGAVAPARRRRALGGIERVPRAGEMGQIGAARVDRAAEISHWILLRADRFRHLRERDDVVAQARMSLQAARDVLPQRQETRAVDPRGESRRQQRRVVIAKFRAEPGEFAHPAGRADRKRQHEQYSPGAVAPHHDGGLHAVPRADMALPGRQPIETLEHGAIGVRFEGPPFALDRRQILIDRDRECRRARRPATTPACAPWPDRRRNARQGVLGQLGPWPDLGIGALGDELRPTGVHNPLTRPPRLKCR